MIIFQIALLIFLIIVLAVILKISTIIKNSEKAASKADAMFEKMDFPGHVSVRSALTADEKKLNIDINLKIQILNTEAAFKQNGSSGPNLKSRTDKLVISAAKFVLKNITYEQLTSESKELEQKIQSKVNETALTFGVRITQLQIEKAEPAES